MLDAEGRCEHIAAAEGILIDFGVNGTVTGKEQHLSARTAFVFPVLVDVQRIFSHFPRGVQHGVGTGKPVLCCHREEALLHMHIFAHNAVERTRKRDLQEADDEKNRFF